MPHLIDTHAHLDESIYGCDLEVVVRQAREDDVSIITVGSDYESSRRAIEIAERYPDVVHAAVGLHPRRVSGAQMADDRLMSLERFGELARHPQVVAVGETGLDFHDLPEGEEDAQRVRENQMRVFSRFLQLSTEARLPLLLHCRGAQEEMLAMLERWDRTQRSAGTSGIVHHFSGSWKEAKRFFDLDFMISATGLLAHGAHREEIFRKAPLDRIVIESDCPHLSSAPWSHRRCEPSYLKLVAASLAGLRRESPEAIARATVENSLKVLTRLRPDGSPVSE